MSKDNCRSNSLPNWVSKQRTNNDTAVSGPLINVELSFTILDCLSGQNFSLPAIRIFWWKEPVRYVLTCQVAQGITSHAAACCGPISARALATLHIRVALSPTAEACVATAPHVLRHVGQAELSGLACT